MDGERAQCLKTEKKFLKNVNNIHKLTAFLTCEFIYLGRKDDSRDVSFIAICSVVLSLQRKRRSRVKMEQIHHMFVRFGKTKT